MSKVKQAIGITLFESDNFGGPKIVGGGICPTQRAEKVCCGIIEVMEMADVKIIGQMDNTIDHTFESANRVYDIGGGWHQRLTLVAVVDYNRRLYRPTQSVWSEQNRARR